MKKGDKVIIREDLVVNEFYGGYLLNSNMKEYIGKEAIITGMYQYSSPRFFLNIDNSRHAWTEQMLIKINDMEKVELNKTDLLKAHEEGCPDVKRTLENLYPEVFEDEIDLSKYPIDTDVLWSALNPKYINKAYCLSYDFNWSLERYKNYWYLVSTKK